MESRAIQGDTASDQVTATGCTGVVWGLHRSIQSRASRVRNGDRCSISMKLDWKTPINTFRANTTGNSERVARLCTNVRGREPPSWGARRPGAAPASGGGCRGRACAGACDPVITRTSVVMHSERYGL